MIHLYSYSCTLLFGKIVYFDEIPIVIRHVACALSPVMACDANPDLASKDTALFRIYILRTSALGKNDCEQEIAYKIASMAKKEDGGNPIPK